MAYRRTDKVERRLKQRHAAIILAARAAAAEGGMGSVQIAPVAERAGIAAGTVYRYFPSKTELVTALVAAVSEREIAAMRQAADKAPGPLSALAAAITTFAARVLANRSLAWAVIAEPVDAEIDSVRLVYRKVLAAELESRIAAAMRAKSLPEQNGAVSAAAIIGALLEGLISPLAPNLSNDPARAHDAVQALTLLALRAVGVVDAHARGLVVQTAFPVIEDKE
ncbi:MAG TPA: TetR/AcrR family transcriptional regulator [Xanthobacteraceae bacterium]|jgi:AcrR family transcriptional regulator|nr:TetR/AcrR family transcriptional regulator [Xanthobacteraceae bacterium]